MLLISLLIQNFDKAYVVIILSPFISQFDLCLIRCRYQNNSLPIRQCKTHQYTCVSPPYTYTYIPDIGTCVLISENVELSPSTVLNIKSPGYPDVNYKNHTVLIWNVTAPATTEEIFIDIEMDIVNPPSGLCEDYLKVIFPKKEEDNYSFTCFDRMFFN